MLEAGVGATGVVGSLVEVTPAVDPVLIADLGYRFVVVELTSLNGSPAVRANVTAVGSNQIYFAE